MAEAYQRLLFDLSDTLSRDPQNLSDLLERHRVLLVQTEVESKDLRLTLLQCGEGFPVNVNVFTIGDVSISAKVMKWGDDKKNITVTFTNDKVVSKAQSGL